MVNDSTEQSKLISIMEPCLSNYILLPFHIAQNKNPLHKAELEALVRDISAKQENKKADEIFSCLFKALEVQDWGTSLDDHVEALELWSKEMGSDGRSHLAYHLKRIRLPLMGKK